MSKAKRPLRYKGVLAKNPPDVVRVARAPTSADSKYLLNTIWVDTSTDDVYMLSNMSGTATWTILGYSASGVADVPHGGTGLSTITDHGVMVGSGTSAVTPLAVGTNGQLLVGSTGADPVFATVSSSGSITPTVGAGTLALDVSSDWLQVATVTVSSAEVLTLASTPKELVAAPAAGSFIQFISAQLILDYNSAGYAESGDNMAIRYTDGSGVIVSQTIEATGFIDQTADTITNALPKIDAIVAATGANAQALVLHNTGSNYTTGDSPLTVKIAYRIIASGL